MAEDGCHPKQMSEDEKDIIDPKFKTVAEIDLAVSQNIDALKDKIDYAEFKVMNCIIRYKHSTQTARDLGLWI